MLTAMGNVMREAYSRGWITTRDGNISVYRKPDCLYVTPSAVRKNKIEVEDLIKMKRKGEKLIIPDKVNPSIELDMHFLIHKNKKIDRKWLTGAVVHLHPTNCVAAMHKGIELRSLVHDFPELSRYTKVGVNVLACDPGSEDLADDTARCIENNDIVGQIGHGVTAYAKDPWSAFEHIERLEHICEIVLKSQEYKCHAREIINGA